MAAKTTKTPKTIEAITTTRTQGPAHKAMMFSKDVFTYMKENPLTAVGLVVAVGTMAYAMGGRR